MVSPFLCFHGRTEEAVNYYQHIFGFELTGFLKFTMVPNRNFNVPEDFLDKVMFTEFTISGTRIMACDAYPGIDSVPGQGMSLNIIESDKEKIETWFRALAKDGQIGMDLQPALWAPTYGSLCDKYGVIWQFSHNA